MTEKQLQAAVLELAGYYKWRCYHTFDSRRSQAGFPDLVMVREIVLFVELKSARGALSEAQKDWADALCKADAEWFVWRPADWLDGTIERMLKGSA